VYDGLNPVKQAVGATTVNLLTGLGIDEYLTRTTGGTTEYLLSEALGSTVALADGSGAVATEYSYEPFGTATVSGTSSNNELGYTGREDDGTGVYYYRARYYHPALQRFISEDPIGIRGGDVNFYAYVANNPLGQRDPLGLQAVPIPGPGAIPIPFPPVFIPGTPENEAFAQATGNAIQAASAAISNILTSIVRKCGTPQFMRCTLAASEEMTPGFFKCIYECPDGSKRTRLRVPLRCPPTMEFVNN
jgi:RHS repeat-associated protein